MGACEASADGGLASAGLWGLFCVLFMLLMSWRRKQRRNNLYTNPDVTYTRCLHQNFFFFSHPGLNL